MDNRTDNFGSGFVAGAIFGGVVGGLLGSFLTSRLAREIPPGEEPFLEGNPKDKKPRREKRRRPFKPTTELSIEEARQGLEVKIAQLNEAIDDVRHQLGNVNGSTQEE